MTWPWIPSTGLVAVALLLCVAASFGGLTWQASAQTQSAHGAGLGLAASTLNQTANQTASVNTISVYTTYPGQNQYLALPPNATGVIIYPHWVVTLVSSTNDSYSIYVSGLEIAQGDSLGVHTVDFGVVGRVINVSIGFGPVVYHYDHEFLSNVPLSAYYSSPPAPPVATALEVTFDELAIAFAFVLSLAGAMFTARKTVIERKKRQIQVVG